GSASWICGQDTDTTLSAEQIKNMLAQNIVDLASGSTINGEQILSPSSTIEWGQLNNVPNGLDDGDNDTTTPDWNDIQNIPSDIADGDDKGIEIECSEGEILTYTNGQWTCSPFNTVIDADGDGALTWNDCDDNDPNIGNQSQDQDCDGTSSADDCDDNDPNSTIVSTDADCDGAPTADDCNDNDSALGAQSNDADCDGILTADDCNDNDNTQPNSDADCDGVLTSDDCDDSDPTSSTEGLSSNCAATSCKSIVDNGNAQGDGTYYIDAGTGSSFPVYCDMSTDGGGWTLILMVKDGDINTFRYDSSYWSSTTLLNENIAAANTDENMKNQAYHSLSFSQIRLSLNQIGNDHIISTSQNNASDLFTGGHFDPGFSRDDYLNWHPQSNSQWDNQPHCNKKGFQPSANQTNCRYGITMNNENECNSNDSAIGFGCHTNNYYPNRNTAAGGHRWNPDQAYSTRGWVFVR
ncbi:MAG: hypothetical protein CMK59_03135, partial [Proteobacteria bacterium]|nr:hypothetical protein [Pseudomonadota bacterium]